MEQLLTLREAEAALRLGPSMVGKLTTRGELPVVRLGRRVLVRRTDLDEFILSHRHGDDSTPKEAA
jgi:excisionase family DNA binding protein